ncbi:lytic transglycosylase domain-containing protein [Nocardia vinacea]|uniref:lytic transglycosylase domain-containing protein n=1 Tax=Nocardia vinacea TaxID=96468 RepID=UPI0002F9B2D7|nr:transglycosylase SLT domain-containing protein [Nocardia vinacea]
MPEPSVDDARATRAGVATSEPRRNSAAPARGNAARAAPLPSAGAATLAAPGSAATALRGQSASPVPGLPTPPATSALGDGSDLAAAAAGAGPLAAAAMGALASISAQYGGGTPSSDTGRSYAPPMVGNGAPTGPVLWDGAFGSQYSASSQNRSQQNDALGNLNAELGRILGGAADNTIQGRAAIASIIAEADAALTALGAVGNSAATQRQVMVALGDALQRAGTVLGNGQSAATVSAEQIAALANRYVQDSGRSRPQVYSRAASGGPPSTQPSGEVGQWINSAMQILRQNGYDISQINPADIAAIIQHESAGNPHAINGWDSNAAAGHPSKGLMQTIDSTFNAHALPGHRDIWNPVDNIIAGVRYAIDRYGSVANVPGIVKLHHGGGYVGY